VCAASTRRAGRALNLALAATACMLQTNTAAKASCCLTHRYSILSVIVFIPATDAASPMPGKTYMLLHCKHHQPDKQHNMILSPLPHPLWSV
jgi:hypothetical protein